MSGFFNSLFILFVGAMVLLIIKRFSAAGSRRRRPSPPLYKNTPLPKTLGLQKLVPLQPAVLRLERALGESYAAKIKDRVKTAHPSMGNAEFHWKFLELKRYLLMTAVLREVPMFSEEVDDIWHEMLMFTREYTRFGENFVGSTIHHAPHSGEDVEPDPGGRAWFDWVYAQLFVPTPYSNLIWGPFFRYPLSRELIEELQTASTSGVIASRFNGSAIERYTDIRETASLLAQRAMEQAAAAKPGASYTAPKPAAGSPEYMPYLAGALMMYSVAEFSDFEGLMEQHFVEEEARQRAASASGSSSCSSACGSSYWNDDRSDHGGHGDSGGGSDNGGSSSSCSSGSSCSSCGGGGD
ncbi:glycine-rich domain-containing protein [Paenibacillus puerhi]|uniref:hypothetical protein n=1 Tax=Paenibacillus puerhi TaxID=2692622 RepID=UPI001356FC33|nr:hypothetical protein [Paenibacillus puerhi]